MWTLDRVAALKPQPKMFTEAMMVLKFDGFSPLTVELLIKFSARHEVDEDGSLLLTFTDDVQLRIPRW